MREAKPEEGGGFSFSPLWNLQLQNWVWGDDRLAISQWSKTLPPPPLHTTARVQRRKGGGGDGAKWLLFQKVLPLCMVVWTWRTAGKIPTQTPNKNVWKVPSIETFVLFLIMAAIFLLLPFQDLWTDKAKVIVLFSYKAFHFPSY